MILKVQIIFSKLMTIFIILLMFFLNSHASWGIEISDLPMETIIKAAPPNIMYVYDNSGSMDWEFMTPDDEDGLFNPYGYSYWWDKYLYVFDNDDYSPSDDNNYSYGSLSGEARMFWASQWSGYNRLYYNPENDYSPWPRASYGNADLQHPRSNPIYSSPTFDLTATFMTLSETSNEPTPDNPLFISCNTHLIQKISPSYDHDWFKIVLTSSGTLTVRTMFTGDCTDVMGRILDEDENEYRHDEWADSWSDPFGDGNYYDDDCQGASYCDFSCDSSYDRNFYITLDNVSAGTYYIDVRGYGSATGTYELYISFTGTCEDAPNLEPIDVKNAHYFAVDDVNENGEVDSGENVYLVNFSSFSPVNRDIYLFEDKNNDGRVQRDELTLLSDVPAIVGSRSAEEDLQNFANWFTYYRRRELTAKAAVGYSIDKFTGVNIGLYTINYYTSYNPVRQSVLDVDTHKSYLLDELYKIDSYGGTPLRYALLNVGRYFDADDGYSGNLGSAPWYPADEGGACQQSFAILMTDGFWNGSNPYVGNVDGNDGVPYADNYYNTLADVARKFYDDDLNNSLDNIVPTNACDENTRQHLVTYALSFGQKGMINPSYDAYHPCLLGVINGDPNAPAAPVWPNPYGSDERAKIDDLWHAAVNGRGAFYSASNPKELIDALQAISENIGSRLSSGAAVAINSEKLTTGTILYQSTYNSENWTGNLKALEMNTLTGEIGDPKWEANKVLSEQDWDTGRRIITSNGSSGIPFRLDNLTDTQKALLGSNTTAQQNVLDFIRGKAVSGLRVRPSIDGKVDKLGDLVHSAPTLVGNTIYVGGNDGMLHAFDINNGKERFAFIPYSIFSKLKELTSLDYSHKFYVDLTPTVKERVPTQDGNKTILVGGLGAGGKGYFALDITDADSIDDSKTEADIDNIVLWEYPGTNSDSNLGVSLSKVSIVKAHNGEYVVFFGNGYNSNNGHAVLYALDLLDGTVIAQIDTGVGNDNGLSTPVVVDVDGDFVADYVYAGDLKGNLWKFDITDEDPANWKLAFGNNPLFQAIGQPITVRPDVMRHCSKHGYIVVFGTGKYISQNDNNDTSQQTVYGIWDYGDPDNQEEFVGSFSAETNTFTPSPELASANVTLLQQEIYATKTVEGVQYRMVTNNEAIWTTHPDSDGEDYLPDPYGHPLKSHVGWYVNLGGSGFEGERVVRDIVIRNGKAIVITVIPNNSPCSGGGRSVIYEFDACDGSRPDLPVFDVNHDTKLDSGDLITVNDNDDESEEKEPPTGPVFETIVHDPVFLEIPGRQQEFKYFSTAQGTIVRIREPLDFTGIYYWIEW